MMIYHNTPPAYSFQPKRTEVPRGKDLPGPGHYNPVVQAPALLTQFSKSDKFSLQKTDAPGPGTYETSARLSPGLKVSLGPRRDTKYDNAVPGPGSYDHRDLMQETSPIRFGRSPRDHSAEKAVPGPGSYEDAAFSLSTSLPGFSLSKSKKEPSYYRKTDSPGPTAYDPQIRKKNDRSIYLGKSPKLPWEAHPTPGPGSYDPKSPESEMRISLHSKVTDLLQEHKKQIPGPGSYSPRLPEEQHTGSVFLPKGKREYSYHKKGDSVPAPGDYDVSNPFQRKGFSFTKAGKFVMEKGTGPHYDVPSSIGVIQNYHKRS